MYVAIPSTATPHDGGPCPVDPNLRVRVYFRHGGCSSDDRSAFYWDWEHAGLDAAGYDKDITGFEVIN